MDRSLCSQEMLRMLTKRPIVAVLWNDAWCERAEASLEDQIKAHKPYPFLTVGYLIKSDAEGVSMAQEVGGDAAFRYRTFIPRGMILDEWIIKGEVFPRLPRQKKPVTVESMSSP